MLCIRVASSILHRRLVVKHSLLIGGLGGRMKTRIVIGVVFHWLNNLLCILLIVSRNSYGASYRIQVFASFPSSFSWDPRLA